MKADEKLSEKVQEMFFEKILARQENLVCGDCNAKGPRWVSLSFGLFICMRCAGPHRGLGPIYTKVKSVKLDIWTRDIAEIMEKTGNKIANDYWECKMPIGYKKPTVSSSQTELERFVQDKYVKRLFAPPEFIDPVTEYLDAKKNGITPKQQNYEPKPEIQKELPRKMVEKPKLLPKPVEAKKHRDLLEEDRNDLLNDLNNQDDFGEFVVAQNHPAPPLTPKIQTSAAASIMDMYKKPVEPIIQTNEMKNSFPINHSYMNNVNFMSGGNNNNASNWNMMYSQQQQSYNTNNNMNMGNHFKPHMNMGNFNGGGMNMMGFPINNSNNSIGGGANFGQINQVRTNFVNGVDVKTKNSGDIMNLYNNIQTDTALNGNEMQMNKKGGLGQGPENMMGLYTGKNFNVW